MVDGGLESVEWLGGTFWPRDPSDCANSTLLDRMDFSALDECIYGSDLAGMSSMGEQCLAYLERRPDAWAVAGVVGMFLFFTAFLVYFALHKRNYGGSARLTTTAAAARRGGKEGQQGGSLLDLPLYRRAILDSLNGRGGDSGDGGGGSAEQEERCPTYEEAGRMQDV